VHEPFGINGIILFALLNAKHYFTPGDEDNESYASGYELIYSLKTIYTRQIQNSRDIYCYKDDGGSDKKQFDKLCVKTFRHEYTYITHIYIHYTHIYTLHTYTYITHIYIHYTHIHTYTHTHTK
jgi:hypothetical protein